MSDIEKAKEKLAKDTTCVLVKEDKIILSKDKGIAPILKLINAGENLENFTLADRIVGKAVAMLVVYSKIREVYAEVLSEKGEEVLKKHYIKYSYKTLTENIINRKGDDICPMEKTDSKICDATLACHALKKKVEELKNLPKN